MINLAADGDAVLTERLDMIRTPGGDVMGVPVMGVPVMGVPVMGVPVMGTLVVRDGKIVRWTDYWDLGLPHEMMTGENVSALVPAY
jgi:limonene-1,2-epoxide hydrolase